MREIPSGNAAISIAHPSHEIRIHGFISRVKPFAFVMTDGSGMGSTSSLFSFQNYFKSIHRGNQDAFFLMLNGKSFITEENIYTELLAKRHYFFEGYTKLMAGNMLRKKIDYMVADSSEEYSATHEICRIMTDLAIRYIKKTTGKEIGNYDFAIYKNILKSKGEEFIDIALTEQELNDKIMYFSSYHPYSFVELKNNISLDLGLIQTLQQTEGGVEQIKKILLSIGKDFFLHEYIRPYKYQECVSNKCYHTRELVEKGLIPEAITYQEHILPIKEKLESLLGLN